MTPATVASVDSTVNRNGSIKLKTKAGTAGMEKANVVPDAQISKLFSLDAILKIWKTATEHLARENPPQTFPETCPQSGSHAGRYLYRDAKFWTCGFFPGCLYCLYERSIKYPQMFYTENSEAIDAKARLKSQFLDVCRRWAEPLHEMSDRTDTHDIGFIIEPALRRDFELTGNQRSLKSILNAAENLAGRYNENTKAIRSWDKFINNAHNYTNKDSHFLVIIDSMCNLDLLYYAGHHASRQRLIDIATIHAHTVRRTHLREETTAPGSKYPAYSTCHVADMCPKTGDIAKRLTAQGYSDTSTWTRGQAWAILGFAQTFTWTKEVVFLRTACGLVEHFIARLESAPACVEQFRNGVKVGRYVPLWDFDAPIDETNPLRDTSAAMIAANGILLLSSSLMAADDTETSHRYYKYAMTIVRETITLCYAGDKMELVAENNGSGFAKAIFSRQGPPDQLFECILKGATANFNAGWTDKYANHGLVYADYYLLEFGNRLLQLGYA